MSIPLLSVCIDASPRRSPRCNFFFCSAEVFLMLAPFLRQSPNSVRRDPGRRPGCGVKREKEKGRCLSSSPDRSRADFRRNDARGISNSIARSRCTCLRKRISARGDYARKGFDRIQFVVSSLPLSLFRSLSLPLSILLHTGTRYMRCTCRCNLDSTKSGVSRSPVATAVAIVVVVVVSSSSSPLLHSATLPVATGAPSRLGHASQL